MFKYERLIIRQVKQINLSNGLSKGAKKKLIVTSKSTIFHTTLPTTRTITVATTNTTSTINTITILVYD